MTYENILFLTDLNESLHHALFSPLWSLQVVRAAEEAASTLAGSIHPEQCIKVLCPIVQTADYPINLAAIKMQTRAIERIAKEPLHQLLSDIIPGLLQVRPSLSWTTQYMQYMWYYYSSTYSVYS